MVLCLKTWESRSPPGLQRTDIGQPTTDNRRRQVRRRPPPSSSPTGTRSRTAFCPPSSDLGPPNAAGWSSPVARQAHNLKAAGSNPAPATSHKHPSAGVIGGGRCCWPQSRSPQWRKPSVTRQQPADWGFRLNIETRRSAAPDGGTVVRPARRLAKATDPRLYVIHLSQVASRGEPAHFREGEVIEHVGDGVASGDHDQADRTGFEIAAIVARSKCRDGSAPGIGARGPSRARTIAPIQISSAGRASAYPPPLPFFE